MFESSSSLTIDTVTVKEAQNLADCRVGIQVARIGLFLLGYNTVNNPLFVSILPNCVGSILIWNGDEVITVWVFGLGIRVQL